MRLLKLNNVGEFSLTKNFVGDDVPRYAILSHTWGADIEEVTFEDLLNGTGKGKSGYMKIRFCGEQAIRDNLQYFWVDTCCIDKSSSAELSEAINSMYAWYKKADVCYAYLSDVSSGVIHEAKWFRRGWTLQELIAPSYINFFSQDWKLIGTKSSLIAELSAITGINESVLAGADLCQVPVAQRMSWASKRITTRVEDIAYSLLGLFDVNMPLIYGEGMKAFRRLQEEIVKQSSDHSLFAWSGSMRPGREARFAGLLATSPSQFKNAGNIFSYSAENEEPYSMTNKGLRIRLPMTKALPGYNFLYIAALSCYRIGEDSGPVVLFLEQLQGNEFARWASLARGEHDLQTTMTWDNKSIFVKESNYSRSGLHMSRSIQIQLTPEDSTNTTDERGVRCGFRLAAVTPPNFWNGSKVTLPEDLELEQSVAFIFQRGGRAFTVHIRLRFARDHVKWEVRIDILTGYDVPDTHMSSTIQDSICGTLQTTPLLGLRESKITWCTTSDSVLRAGLYDGAKPPSEEVIISFGAVVDTNIMNLKVEVVEAVGHG